ncbi:probable protein phosphatase 2C 8 [Typha latifolia]|uniref:probable protein phosphatase 2C 8 n=1 Tax=Typha latifolia TaxID=4733 RepID=UPI003C2BFC58
MDGKKSSRAGAAAGAGAGAGRRRRIQLRRMRSDGGKSEPDKRIRARDGVPAFPPSSEEEDSAAVAGLPRLSYGSVSVIGRRREMEDTVAIATAFAAGSPGPEEMYDFFGVYDGHGGAGVAQVCRERMHVVLAEEIARREEGEWGEAMAASFSRVDGEVSAVMEGQEEEDEMTVGSTAVVAVVGRRRIVVANCGDSRAVLSRGGVAVPLTSDHKPERPDEMQRVEAAGGRVINWNGYRVLGVLATSRSIGDYYLKPYVTSEPEVTVTDRTEGDEFLILASDGLWDVVSNDVACKITRNCLSGRAAMMFPGAVNGSTAEHAAALLVEVAMSQGSKDNVSVIVVELRRIGRGRGRGSGRVET